MSYARFSWDGSDVYVYLDVGGYVCCCACSLDKPWQHYSTDSILAHLREHEAAGHAVPSGTYAEIEEDREAIEQHIASVGRAS